VTLTADDRLAMADLASRYNRAVDGGDGEGFANVFTDDAALDLAGNVVQGRAALAAFAGEKRPTRHMTGNYLLEAGGTPDEARGSSTVVVVNLGGPALGVLTAGIYEDEFRRVGGEWRIARRTFTPDVPAG